MPAPITAFTKPDCPYCARAKRALDAEGLLYEQIDVTASDRNADASVYLSGIATVPQVFLGDLHVNGSTDVVALQEAGRLAPLARAQHGRLPLDELSDAELASGAEDVPLRDLIPESDGSRTDDPEAWPILRFYKEFFGFWPNCFYYQHHWPEAYKLFVYCHNAGAIGLGKDQLGAPVMMAAAFSTSNAHGCNYCMVHSRATGGEMSLGMGEMVEAARKGDAPEKSPIGPFELALVDLAADATTNGVSGEALGCLSDLRPQARVTREDVEANIMGTAMIASAFGFLNVFNDLSGVKVEAEWAAEASEKAGVQAGRHGVSEDRASTNLDYDLPQGGPSMEEMMAKYDAIVAEAGGVEPYAQTEIGIFPDWMQLWPEPLRARHAHFYAEVMQDRDHSPIPSELKHLMAQVSATARGHDYLAAIEGYLAWIAGGRHGQAAERVRHAWNAARDPDVDVPFTDAERAALKFAWLSAQTPLTTPRRYVQPVSRAFTQVELVHLMTVCGMASLTQRFCAIVKPEIEAPVHRFHEENGLALDTLDRRYPVPGAGCRHETRRGLSAHDRKATPDCPHSPPGFAAFPDHAREAAPNPAEAPNDRHHCLKTDTTSPSSAQGWARSAACRTCIATVSGPWASISSPNGR
ncbi:glutaredoxin domain-containing protein [Palleronia rufa]|uniref:glutaredoxin domain-containing protein n=1 Tax=Palleronia rufa TaxID=1530186 RepID=UPI0009DE0522|nr:glutaredoxin domain-containing protein [Palleronia rufa]